MASDGGIRRFGPGDVILMEDTWGKGHGGRMVGDGDALAFGVVLADS